MRDEVDADLAAEGVGDVGEHVEAVAAAIGVLQPADDGLDNCKRNMRNCTPEQNSYNRPPWRGNVGFKGVRYNERGGKYMAVIRYKGKDMRLGEFDDPIKAAMARDCKAHEDQGEYAYLNFPDAFAPGFATGGASPGAGDATSSDAGKEDAGSGRKERGRKAKRPKRTRPRYVDLCGSAVVHTSAVGRVSARKRRR